MTPATILIADDSLVIRAVVRGGLETEDYIVIEAHDGVTALEQTRRCRPDVILLDIEMPGLDGHQVLARLKADAELKDIPVVFLTCRTGMDDVVAGLRGGAQDYLKKPFEPAELLARVGSAVHVKRLQDQLWQRNAELDRMTRTDSLTGLYNRRHLEQELHNQLSSADRHHDPLSVILLDIDHFKNVNDTFGHPAGDLVLDEFARRLNQGLRAGDIAGRWGGEEFMVILPRTDLTSAVDVAERIRTLIAATTFNAAGQRITVTVSGGCALGPTEDPGALIQVADTHLYQAKASGRNRILASVPLDIKILDPHRVAHATGADTL
jgi:two-component system, cell cycle response regulator